MDPTAVATILEKGGTAAIIGLLFYMWRDATSRADRLQLERDALLERVLTQFNAATQAIKDQGQILAGLVSGRRPTKEG